MDNRVRIGFCFADMPSTSPAFWLSAADTYLAHWSEADVSSETPVRVIGGGRELLDDLKVRLTAVMERIATLRCDLGGARHEVLEQVQTMSGRLSALRAKFPDLLPESSASPDLIPQLDRAVSAWQSHEREKGGTLTLGAGYGRLDFLTDLSALKLVESSVATASRELKEARGLREGLLERLQSTLEEYEYRVEERFGPGHPVTAGVPRIRPRWKDAGPGVEVTAVWTHPTAKLEWSACDAPDLVRYEVRGQCGDDPEPADEWTIARVAKKEPRTLETTAFLDTPGVPASFRVWSVFASGQECPSEVVNVVRPG